MDFELTTTDLLSKKRQIICYYYRGYVRLLTLFGVIASLSALFFFTFANFIYQTLLQIIHGYISQNRLTTLVNISKSIGSFLCLSCFIFTMAIVIKMILLYIFFPDWLKKQLSAIQETIVIGQTQNNYLLSLKNKQFTIKKSTSQLVTTFLEETQLKIGQRSAPFGLAPATLFLLTSKPIETLNTPSRCNWNKIFLFLFSFVMILGIMSACIFMVQTESHQELADEFNYQQGILSRTLSEPEVNDTVVTQIGDTPTDHIKEPNYLRLQGKELYMTTDSGTTWQFVPIKPEWLQEQQLLTRNLPQKNDWLEQTYNIESEFSWFIFSPNSESQSLYQLSSRDKGKTWQKSLITNQFGPIRYRKVTFFEDGSGVAVFSTTFSHSD